MLYFPFDTQTCNLKFGSWSYSKSTLNLQHTSPNNDLKGNVRSILYNHFLIEYFRQGSNGRNQHWRFGIHQVNRVADRLKNGHRSRGLVRLLSPSLPRKQFAAEFYCYYTPRRPVTAPNGQNRYNIFNQSKTISILSCLHTGRAMRDDGHVDHVDVYSPAWCWRESWFK